MEPNALRHTRDANIQMMTGIARSESTFSRLENPKGLAVTDSRMPNPYLGEDHVEVMKWFLKKVCNREFSKAIDMLLSAYWNL